MKLYRILLTGLFVVSLGACKNDAKKETAKNTTASADVVTTKVDTGVGENGVALASSPAFAASGGVVVTMDNVVRAETSKYLAAETLKTGPNKFRHELNGIQLDAQTIIRSNFDLIYSYAVYDISKGLTISVPEYDLYQIVQVLDENSVTIAVVYPGKTVELSKDDVSYGEHVYLFMRTQPRIYDDQGMEEMRARQQMVTVEAGASSPYRPAVQYELGSFNKLRNDLIKRAPTEGVIYKGFIDTIKNIDVPNYQLINTAGWGGLPAKHAYYFVVLPADEAAKNGEPSSVTFAAPELEYDKAGYWSITVYNEDGWVKTDNFFTNSLKAEANADGSYTINFNSGEDAKNNLEVPKNWNALFRCYIPKSVDNIVQYQKDFMKDSKVTSK